jgi:ATP-dependent Clp protease ATP-binding subunit ClpA
MRKQELTNEQVIEQWLECDVSARAAAGDLPRAYEVEDLVSHVQCLLAARCRPLVVGESGVGKTAIVWEVVRRVLEAGAGHPLAGKRVLQLSLSKRAASLKDPCRQIRPEMDRLVDALAAGPADVVPFFRDAHLAEAFGMEALLESLAFRLNGPFLCEGLRGPVDAMIEERPGLAQQFVLVNVDEPSRDQVASMLQGWSADQALSRGTTFEASALETGLDLCHRFLARSRMPRKVLDLLVQAANAAGPGGSVTSADIIERFCINSSIPRLLVDPAVPVDLADLHSRFGRRILGQPAAIQAMVDTVGIIKSGLSDARRLLGAFLFVGPTGVGKTLVAQLLAEYLFGSRDCLVRINMADHQLESSPGVLFGDPEQYRQHLMRGVLTQRLAGRNFGVLLLDEFEKAHSRVHDRFLQLIDEGCFINGAGELVSCRSMILIATSNAGTEVYRGEIFGFSASGSVTREQELARRLRQHFRIELLNRFDRVVRFRPLAPDDIRRVAIAELGRLAERGGLRHRGLELVCEAEVVDWLTRHGFDVDFGARHLCHAIQRDVSAAIARLLLSGDITNGRVELFLQGEQLGARFMSRPAATREELLDGNRAQQVS